MGFSSILMLLFSLVNLFQLYECATVVVDGISEWNNPQVQIGDSVIFQHKHHYRLYIFKNQNAFSLCNFTQATLLTNPNSSVYIWHTSRPGFFYFSFYNGSNEACLRGQKLAVTVSFPAAAPELPPPSSGGSIASSPVFPWPSQPRGSAPPSPAPQTASPEKQGIPFINSNPAVPLPTGEVDSATIRPLPTSAHSNSKKVVGFSDVQKALSSVILLLIMF